ncbi:hypothetical protein MLD38_023479 [Melastoma candidum]|uniref:Uncharacterized protein n=1 Tax=Melastoma candidum TaxID=119954 RepID=A0ACB9NQF4_9MYRT|nr:hypothetical protein MLD38_023479 [Melastoma candidum]
MALTMGQDHPLPLSPNSVQSLDEIMAAYRALPPRPTIEELLAARSLVETVDLEEKMKLDEITRQESPRDVPEELSSILRDVRRTAVQFRSFEQRKEALLLIEAEKMFDEFDQLIRRASEIVFGGEQPAGFGDVKKDVSKNLDGPQSFAGRNGDNFAGSGGGGPGKIARSGSAKVVSSVYADREDSVTDPKLSLMKVAALIEDSARTGTETLDLRGKLKDDIEWLPVSLGKLSAITELDLSDNCIMALPPSIGSLRALTKFCAHSNRLSSLPESLGDLTSVQELDLHANHLKSLPTSFGKLTRLLTLDLSSNDFSRLPDTIGNLSSLQKLNVETNQLEELPYTISSCTSLEELKLDFNQLKALPEAIGKLESLEILTLHYNRLKGLPTTTGNLSNLKELDVSFNELESIPENLSFAVSLEKLNLGKNFADLRALPRSIGNLEMLEELDISDNQIRSLPDSFRFLSRLRVLRADETPLELPPREIAKLGAQAVVKYMADHVVKREAKSLPSKDKKKEKRKRGFWLPWLCWISPSPKMPNKKSIDHGNNR